jgi:uncharacterized sulfatase
MSYKNYFSIVILFMLIGSCSPDSKIKGPNILFVISDDQSYQHTSFAGCKFIDTPGFDKVASEGIYFYNCYAGSPGCAPSRSSIVTGRHHWQNEQSGQHAASWMKDFVPFVDELAMNGYSVGRTGKGVAPFRYATTNDDKLRRKENAAGPSFGNSMYNETEKQENPQGVNANNYTENFKYFIERIRGDKPFFYWFGAHEPHRGYEQDSWKKKDKHLKDVEVPGFLPDNDLIRGDLLDYAVEIEWFDSHLLKILTYLEEIGELDNTIVIVTADNGMPFPRAKANCYDYGVHVPLAIRYPKAIKSGSVSKTPVGFIEIAPTILEVTNTTPVNMMPITGQSIWNIITNKEDNYERPVFSGRERHSSSRYLNKGYPQRSIRKGKYLMVWNMAPLRWPAGAPQKYDEKDTTLLLPRFGINANGKYEFEGVFADIDESPSKSFLIENHQNDEVSEYFNLAVQKRPMYELYDIETDQFCTKNLAGLAAYISVENELKAILTEELQRTNDPRVLGPKEDIFDTYPRYSRMRKFPEPNSR